MCTGVGRCERSRRTNHKADFFFLCLCLCAFQCSNHVAVAAAPDKRNDDSCQHENESENKHHYQHKHARNIGLQAAPQTAGEIQHIAWANGTIVDPFAVQIKLPKSLAETVRKYCDDVGITGLYKRIFQAEGHELKPGTDKVLKLDDVEWYLQRPESKWKSNMHWLNGNDERAHDRYLALLGKGGFDMVLDALGRYFDLQAIDVYSAGFIGVSHCTQGFMHYDFSGANGKAFNVLIPLQLVESEAQAERGQQQEAGQEFLVQSHHDDQIVRIHYEYDVALAVGDDTWHATAECDYRDRPGKFRMAMSIYLGDIDQDNVDAIIGDYTDPFPPAEPEYLLNNRGRHWKKDGSAHLPNADTYGGSVVEGESHQQEETTDERQIKSKKKNPKQWTDFNRDDFWLALDCPEVFQTDRPVPSDATWQYLRNAYQRIVGSELSSIPSSPATKTGGFKVGVQARQSEGMGRGIFATQPISKGSLVWSAQFTARFPDAASYRQLLLTISPDLACEAMPWSYIQPSRKNKEKDKFEMLLSMDMDIGALINSGGFYEEDGSFDDPAKYEYEGSIPKEWVGYANVGCIPNDMPGGCDQNYFALRDIHAGEELFVHYGDFADIDAWWEIGLECTLCDVTDL